MLVLFGFRNCPDICPTQISKLSLVMRNLDKTGHRRLVTPIFISVDPERDKPENMASYLSPFHEEIVGLSGSRTALENPTRTFKTYLQAADDLFNQTYSVTHSSLVYLVDLVDPFGRIVDHIAFESDAESITTKLKAVL